MFYLFFELYRCAGMNPWGFDYDEAKNLSLQTDNNPVVGSDENLTSSVFVDRNDMMNPVADNNDYKKTSLITKYQHHMNVPRYEQVYSQNMNLDSNFERTVVSNLATSEISNISTTPVLPSSEYNSFPPITAVAPNSKNFTHREIQQPYYYDYSGASSNIGSYSTSVDHNTSNYTRPSYSINCPQTSEHPPLTSFPSNMGVNPSSSGIRVNNFETPQDVFGSRHTVSSGATNFESSFASTSGNTSVLTSCYDSTGTVPSSLQYSPYLATSLEYPTASTSSSSKILPSYPLNTSTNFGASTSKPLNTITSFENIKTEQGAKASDSLYLRQQIEAQTDTLTEYYHQLFKESNIHLSLVDNKLQEIHIYSLNNPNCSEKTKNFLRKYNEIFKEVFSLLEGALLGVENYIKSAASKMNTDFNWFTTSVMFSEHFADNLSEESKTVFFSILKDMTRKNNIGNALVQDLKKVQTEALFYVERFNRKFNSIK